MARSYWFIGSLLMVLPAAVAVHWFYTAAMSRRPPPEPQTSLYSTAIVFPVEAFGANWHVKNFRRKVKFPDGFQPAMERALAAAEKLDRPVAISIAPTTYTLTKTLMLTGHAGISLHGSRP